MYLGYYELCHLLLIEYPHGPYTKPPLPPLFTPQNPTTPRQGREDGFNVEMDLKITPYPQEGGWLVVEVGDGG